MNVLYDVSVLGLGYHIHKARTGIFRVIDNVAENIIKHRDCNVVFCADNSIFDLKYAAEHLKQKNCFANNKLSFPAIAKWRLAIDEKIIKEEKNLTKSNLPPFQKLTGEAKFYFWRTERKLKMLLNNHPINLIEKRDLKYADIYHTPFYAIPDYIKEKEKKIVFLTSYDLIPILYPQYVEEGVIALIKNVLDSITPDTWVLCISEATRNDLLNYLGNRIDANKVFVTELAASNTFYKSTDTIKNNEVKQKYKIPDAPYILSLCTLEPRKNIDQAIRAFAKLVRQENMPDVNLVLVGTKGWMFDKIFEEIDANHTLRNKIIITGFVPDEDLAAIYSDAMMFVYPSFYEGFGLPPLEAMQCGVPVITSNTSSLPEVVGDAGIMINPTDLDALCNAMLSIYKSSALQTELSQKSFERAKHFSWERCAEETVAAYKMSLG